jgi:hypothetical protein
MKKCKSCGAPLEGFMYNTIGKLMGVKPSANDPETCNKCADKPAAETTEQAEPSMPQQPTAETTPEVEEATPEAPAEEAAPEETTEEEKPEQNV